MAPAGAAPAMLLGPVVRLPFPRRFDLARVLAVRLDMFFQEPLRRFVLVLELRKLAAFDISGSVAVQADFVAARSASGSRRADARVDRTM